MPEALYPPVDTITEDDGFVWQICANGHKFATSRKPPSCHTCEEDAKFEAMGRPECTEDGCHTIVKCSERAWDAGVRKCELHWIDEGGWTAGPICLDEYVTVLGQYMDRNRWNGWLMPQIDAYSVEMVKAALDSDDDNYRYEWQDDLSLKVTNVEDPEYPEILHPNEDGLYALGAGSWTWSEDTDYAATEEWDDWSLEGRSVWVKACNYSNQTLAKAGVLDRNRNNQEYADAEYAAWLTDNPEPQKYPDGRTALPVPGQKEI